MTRTLVACLALSLCTCMVSADRAEVEADLTRVADLIEGFTVVELPAAGEVVLSPASSVTIEDLVGSPLS